MHGEHSDEARYRHAKCKNWLEPQPGPSNSGTKSKFEPVIFCACVAGLRQVETIEVHHLIPGRDKVMNKLSLRVGTSINFGKRPKLGI